MLYSKPAMPRFMLSSIISHNINPCIHKVLRSNLGYNYQVRAQHRLGWTGCIEQGKWEKIERSISTKELRSIPWYLRPPMRNKDAH